MMPRYRALFSKEAEAKHSVFRGQAGPLDIWEDTFDAFTPYCVFWDGWSGTWCSDAERVIMRAKAEGVHLTLHDECMVYQICNSDVNMV